jgi:hypothetical protein
MKNERKIKSQQNLEQILRQNLSHKQKIPSQGQGGGGKFDTSQK